MEQQQDNGRPSIGERLQSVNRNVLYLCLFVVVSSSLVIAHLFTIGVPAEPQECTKNAYEKLRNLHPGDTIIIDTAYTNSSRGENGGEMEAVLRMAMREKVKFVLYTYAEPQCIEVAKGVIDRINEERRKAKTPEPEYKEWDDYVVLGFFPDGATMLQTVASNIRDAWGAKKDKDETGAERPVFESPVLKNIQKIEDIKAYVSISASSVMPTIVARLQHRLPIISMITGVMFPEQFNYYKSGQLQGLINGLVGTVEFETLMDKGIDANGVVGGHAEGPPIAAPFPGDKNFARGMDYYLAFCCAMTLLIVAIVVGNVGMFLERRRMR
jgi:hypothetical protein